jgi:hypothetical protein
MCRDVNRPGTSRPGNRAELWPRWLSTVYLVFGKFGGPDRDRTGDLLNAIQEIRDFQQLTATANRSHRSSN